MPPPPDIDALSLPEVKSLVLELLAERAELLRTVGTPRDEIARLKGGPGRPDIKPNVKPDIKPSGMEQASEARVHEERKLEGRRAEIITLHGKSLMIFKSSSCRASFISKR